MYKKLLTIAACAALTSCAAERNRTDDPWARTGPDWAENCERFSSETPHDYAACLSRVEAKIPADPNSIAQVGLSRDGTNVGELDEIKEAEPGDRSIQN